MANYDNQQSVRYGTSVAGGAVAIDEGLRAHMLRVYNYMAVGLALTGVAAYLTYSSGLVFTLLSNQLLFWVIVLAPLGMVFFLSFRINSLSVAAAQATFWVYASWSASRCRRSFSSTR